MRRKILRDLSAAGSVSGERRVKHDSLLIRTVASLRVCARAIYVCAQELRRQERLDSVCSDRCCAATACGTAAVPELNLTAAVDCLKT